MCGIAVVLGGAELKKKKKFLLHSVLDSEVVVQILVVVLVDQY